MGFLTGFLAVWIVSSLSLYLLSMLPTGIRLDGIGPAIAAGLVLGLLNALLLPVLRFISMPLIWISFGLFSVVLNGLIFMLASRLVSGFELKRGCLTALIGAILLSLLNSLIFAILSGVG